MMIVNQGEEEVDLHNQQNDYDDDNEEALLLLPPRKDPFQSLFTNLCAGASGGGGGVPLILCDPFAKQKENHERDSPDERHVSFINKNKYDSRSGVDSPLSPLSIAMDTTATLEEDDDDDDDEDHCTLSTTSTVEAGVGGSFKRTTTGSVAVPRILIGSCLVQEEEDEEATKYTSRELKKKNLAEAQAECRKNSWQQGIVDVVVPPTRTTTTTKPASSGDNLLKKAGQVLLFLAIILYLITSSFSSLQHKNLLARQEQQLLQQDQQQQQQQHQRDLRILQQELDLFVSPGILSAKMEFNVNRWWNGKGRQQIVGTLRGATMLPVLMNSDDDNNNNNDKAIAKTEPASDVGDAVASAETAGEKSRKRRSRRIGYVVKPMLSQMNDTITKIVKEARAGVRLLRLGKKQQTPEHEDNHSKRQRPKTKETRNPTTTRKI